MAMDKERLFAYFQTNYLPREEVLFKLPFSISIDTFWPELLNRRKARAVVLPLRNGNGVPYWYTLTERMIAASETLCEKAMLQREPADPCRFPMTSAMTEEMFFTSLVEGAQIQIADAMSFLQGGTEPEDIQEQMIWNNRQAWSAMTGSLLHPLDETYIKGLALLLTTDMNGQAEDYRQADTHPIAAMADMTYTVPPASVIPDRMQEFYAFLRNPDVHPLIKAAASQAFLLVTRPFPEGNERLSRMVSAAVLLRSGYDFFRDISISSVIARESYRYYKAMKEIIRTQNGGDLTYFMEYYLELLVRAVADREERDRRIEQEKREQEAAEQEQLLAKERSMAVVPLMGAASRDATESAKAETHASNICEDNPGVDMLRQEETTGQELLPEEVSPDESPPADVRAAYFARFQALAAASPVSRKSILQKLSIIRSFLDRGVTKFTSAEYRQEGGLSQKAPFTACNYLLEHGLVTMKVQNNVRIYTMAFPGANETLNMAGESPDSPDDSPSFTTRALHALHRLYEAGQASFTSSDIRDASGIPAKRICDVCRYLAIRGLLTADRTARPIVYRLTDEGVAKCLELDDHDAPVFSSDESDAVDEAAAEVESNSNLMKRLNEMDSDQATERDRRIGSFFKERCRAGKLTFTRDEWKKVFPFTKSVITADLRYAMNIGLLERNEIHVKGGGVLCEYTICTELHDGVNTSGLTENQHHYLTEIHRRFGDGNFTGEKLALLMNTPVCTVGYHLSNLLDRKLLRCRKGSGHAYTYQLAVAPEEHPECFDLTDVKENRQEEVVALPAISSAMGYAAAPSSGAVALSV